MNKRKIDYSKYEAGNLLLTEVHVKSFQNKRQCRNVVMCDVSRDLNKNKIFYIL